MHEKRRAAFYGWRVVGAAFVLAVFGLGIGFHGPAVYLYAVHERTGWPLALVSTAVTLHFLAGAVVVANLPALYRRFGIPTGDENRRNPARGWRVRLGHRHSAL